MTETPVTPLHMRRARFDPVDELVRLRDGEGVSRVQSFNTTAYLVTRYEDVREAFSDPVRFSNAPARRAGHGERGDAERGDMLAGHLLAMDPPDHTRLRRMLAPEFTARRMNRLEPRVVEIVAGALDAVERAGRPADLVSTFAPVPSLVICELLGVPMADHDEFARRTKRQLDMAVPFEERLALQRESRAYMAELVARARVERGEDILGTLVREHGAELTDAELVGMASLLMIAGHETTSNMLSLGTLALLRHPEQLAMIRDDAADVDAAIEELLRWLSPTHGVHRVTTTEVEIGGHTIPAGEPVVLVLPTANRDPAVVPDAGRLDISRGPAGHFAFGHGVHYCLGAPLARMEMRIAFPALLRRFPNLALAVPYDEIAFRDFHFVHGLRALPVTW